MKEWIFHNTASFTVELPKPWSCREEPNGQLTIADPSSSVTMTLAVAGPEMHVTGGGPRSATNTAATPAEVSPREAQAILQRWISGFSNVRPLTPPRQILGSNHMTCTAEGLARPETALGRIKDMINRNTPDCWRFWAVFDGETIVLARCVGACDAMQFLAPVLEAIMCSLEIHPADGRAAKPFVEMVVELGREHVPPEEISAIDDETLNLGGMKIRIDALQQQYQQQPEKIHDNVHTFFDKLLVRNAAESVTGNDDWENLSRQVMPVILPAAVADRLGSQVIQEDWLAGMKIHFEIPGANVPIGRDDCRRWGIDAEELQQQAMNNLLRATRNMQMNGGKYERYTLFNFTRTNAFNSSRILLPILYRNLREHLGTTFYIGIPDRDVLLAFATEDDAVLDWLRNQVQLKYSHAAHPLSQQLFLATPDGIAEVDCRASTDHQTTG